MLYRSLLMTSTMVAVIPSAAHAALPDPVKAMINAAVASENDADIKSVVKLAKSTNPPVGVEKTDTISRATLVYGF